MGRLGIEPRTRGLKAGPNGVHAHPRKCIVAGQKLCVDVGGRRRITLNRLQLQPGWHHRSWCRDPLVARYSWPRRPWDCHDSILRSVDPDSSDSGIRSDPAVEHVFRLRPQCGHWDGPESVSERKRIGPGVEEDAECEAVPELVAEEFQTAKLLLGDCPG